MLIKNKIKFIIIYLLSFFIFTSNVSADEFNITAKEVVIDKENNILVGKGSVTAKDSEGKIITEISNLPKEEAKRFFKGHDLKIIETLIEQGIIRFGKMHYQLQNEISAINT